MPPKAVELLRDFINRFDEIDAETPWSEVEPQWWLTMNEMQRVALKALDTKVPKAA